MTHLIFNCLLIGFLLIGSSGLSVAKTYKFRDENGKLHFTNDPAKVPEKYKKDPNKKPAKPSPDKKEIFQSQVYKKSCVPSKNQYTALHAAANNNNVSEARLLLSNGADLEARDHSCYTALHRAAFSNNFEMVKFLLSKGANPNVVGSGNWDMPLTSAITINKIKIVKLLIENGADANATTVKNTRTPLMYATNFGRIPIMHLLLENGAYANSRDYKGLTALGIALKKGNEKAADL
jgi:ankyrin repeat protein